MECDSDDVSCTRPKKKQRKEKRLQKYKTEWESNYQWCKDANKKYGAKCTLCGISFSIAGSGIGQVSFKWFQCLLCVQILMCVTT